MVKSKTKPKKKIIKKSSLVRKKKAVMLNPLELLDKLLSTKTIRIDPSLPYHRHYQTGCLGSAINGCVLSSTPVLDLIFTDKRYSLIANEYKKRFKDFVGNQTIYAKSIVDLIGIKEYSVEAEELLFLKYVQTGEFLSAISRLTGKLDADINKKLFEKFGKTGIDVEFTDINGTSYQDEAFWEYMKEFRCFLQEHFR